MPKSTFYNLSKEKKDEIIRVCFEEFALNDYDHASISRIVKKLGIAKGSFYRYFDSKKELYQFLIDQATALRMEYVKELFELPSGDFFSSFEQNLEMIVRFGLSHPVQSVFLHNVFKEDNNVELGIRVIHSKEMLIDLVKPVIEKHQKGGSLRMDLPKDLIAFSIVQIQLGINDFFKIRYTADHPKTITEQQQFSSITERDILHTVKEFSVILAHGLAKREGKE